MANNKSQKTVGMWQAIRDVLVASINKGQFLVAVLAAIVGLIIYRLPEKELGFLSHKIIDRLMDWSAVGWGLSACLVLGWYVHAKWQRRVTHGEMKRLSDERTKLQEKLAGREMSSSKEKP